jgi:thiol-disulfide isomerase/thioredoxin
MRVLAPEEFSDRRLEGQRGFLGVCLYARWCGFCRSFVPRFEERASQAPFELALVDLSSLNDPRWETLEAKVVPTLLLYKDGDLVWRKDGRFGVGLSLKNIDELLAAATAVV